MIFNKEWITNEICSVSSSMVLNFVFSATRAFATGDTVRSKKNLKRKTRLVVDAEKHEISPHLVDIMDRATDGAEGFEKY